LRPAAGPNDFDRLTTLVASQESKNRERDANGNLITSPKGAQGMMQVMPATNKNPGYGVMPAKDDSDAERSRVGRDYLQAMLKEYGGDVNKALAAYNAGPGAVDKAIKDAKDGNYLALLPKETQDYVFKIGSQYGTGAGGKSRVTLEDVQNQVRQQMTGKPASQVKLAVEQVTQLYDTHQKAIKQHEDETVGEAYKMLDANGGNYTALPASIRTALPGDKIDNLQAYAAKRAKGIEPATDWNLYYELRKDETLLKATNLLAFKGRLADSEFKQLVSEQDALRSGKADSVTATRSATQVLNAYLTQAGIDPTPKPRTGEDSDAAKVGRAMRAQQAAITAAETAKGKKLTPDEIEKETAKIFTNVSVKGSWFGTNDKPKFDLKPSDQIVVPDAERKQIVAALQATKRPVNEAYIRELYLRKNNLPGK
jgi:soluble lytic murein transglycosylase